MTRAALCALAAASLAATATVSRAQSGEGEELRYQWRQGLSWTREGTVTNTTRVIGDGERTEKTSTIRVTVADRVFSADEDGKRARIVRTVERIRVDAVGASGGHGVYDSERPSDDPDTYSFKCHRQYGAAIDKAATLVMDDRGSILAFDGRQLEPAHRSLVHRGSRTIPERALVVGDTWTIEETKTTPNMGQLTTIVVYELQEITQRDGEDVAIITIRGGISQENGRGLVLQESEISGTWEIDVSQGRDLSCRTEIRFAVVNPDGTIRSEFETISDFQYTRYRQRRAPRSGQPEGD